MILVQPGYYASALEILSPGHLAASLACMTCTVHAQY